MEKLEAVLDKQPWKRTQGNRCYQDFVWEGNNYRRWADDRRWIRLDPEAPRSMPNSQNPSVSNKDRRPGTQSDPRSGSTSSSYRDSSISLLKNDHPAVHSPDARRRDPRPRGYSIFPREETDLLSLSTSPPGPRGYELDSAVATNDRPESALHYDNRHESTPYHSDRPGSTQRRDDRQGDDRQGDNWQGSNWRGNDRRDDEPRGVNRRFGEQRGNDGGESRRRDEQRGENGWSEEPRNDERQGDGRCSDEQLGGGPHELPYRTISDEGPGWGEDPRPQASTTCKHIGSDVGVSVDADLSARKQGLSPDEDARYYTRDDAKRFFTTGRVFLVWWPQPAGQNNSFHRGKGKLAQDAKKVFEEFQRMAVVREREGYCICIPISTYKGQGVAKNGMKPEERKRHSVIHMDDERAYTSSAEANMMTKKPIAVTAANKEQKLDKMSRIHFGKPASIQHNVMVRNVGKVHKDYMVTFTTYYDREKN